MNTEMLLSDKRFRWISTMYFYVTANAGHTVNHFKNLVDFLEVKVGDLGWSADTEAKNSSKSRFCADLLDMMQSYGYYIPEEEVRKCLSDDEMSNRNMAHQLARAVKVV